MLHLLLFTLASSIIIRVNLVSHRVPEKVPPCSILQLNSNHKAFGYLPNTQRENLHHEHPMPSTPHLPRLPTRRSYSSGIPLRPDSAQHPKWWNFLLQAPRPCKIHSPLCLLRVWSSGGLRIRLCHILQRDI